MAMSELSRQSTRDFHLVRLGVPAKGDTVHRSTCRYAQRPNALRWKWADENPDVDWARVPWLKSCGVCKPPSPAGRQTTHVG
jgi:hypothetical protein